MGASSLPDEDRLRIAQLERDMREVRQGQLANRDHHLRDHVDAETWFAADGRAMVYDAETGSWKPVVPAASWKWYWQTLVVGEGDEDDVGDDCKLFKWSIRLKATGSSTTTVELHSFADGLIDTLTLGSGVKRNAALVGYELAEGDGLFPDLTGMGAGASGLLVSAWAKAV